MTLHDGTAVVAAGGSAKAARLLEIAAEQGFEPAAVRRVSAGYEVPDAVAEAYAENPTPETVVRSVDDQSFQRIETNHRALGFDTLHPDEVAANGGVAVSADQTGVGFDVDLAEGEQDDRPERRTTADKHELTDPDHPVNPEGSTTVTAAEGSTTQASLVSSDTPADGADGADDAAPAKSASKGEWLAYARTKGYEGTDDEVTKDQLVERYTPAS